MASLLLVAFGFVLLVLQSAIGTLVPMHGFAPNLLLPIAMYLGISAEIPLWRGALVSFVLGYLLDAFCGSPMGLQTFALTAAFMLERGVGVRLFPTGPVFQILLTFLMAIVFGAAVLALHAIFAQPSAADFSEPMSSTAFMLLRSAVATALVSPLIFLGTRKLAAVGIRKREHKTIATT